MNFEEYLNECYSLWIQQPYNKETENLLYASNSIGGEIGELQNVVKKIYRDNLGDYLERRDELDSELGDVLWYWYHFCEILRLEPSEIMASNIDKLKTRYNLK